MTGISTRERIHHEIRELSGSASAVSERSPSPQLTLDSSPSESVDSSLSYDKWFGSSQAEGEGYVSEDPTYEELFAQLDLFKFFDSELCLEDRARIVISLIPTFLDSPYAFRPHSGTRPEDIPSPFNATIALVFDVLTELQSQKCYQTYIQAIQESPFQFNDILRVIALGAYSSPIHYLALPFPVLYPTSSTEIFAFLTTQFESITPFQPDSIHIDLSTDNNQTSESHSALTSNIEAALTVSPNYSEFSFYPASFDDISTPNSNSPQLDSSFSQFLQELVPLPNVSSIEEELLTIDSSTYSSGNIDSVPIMTWAQTPKPISSKPQTKPKRVKSNTPKKPSKTIDPSRRIVKCPYENCFHRYTHTSGVKYHLEKCDFRPGVVPVVKPYPCLVPECRKSYKSTSGRKYHLKKFHSDFLEESAMFLSDGGSDDEDQPSKEVPESELTMGNLPSPLPNNKSI